MEPDDRNIEEIDMFDEYEMIPLEPKMYGYEQVNMVPDMNFNPSIGMSKEYMQNVNPNTEMNPKMMRYPCMDMNSNMGMYRSTEVNYNIDTNPNEGISPNIDKDTNATMEPDVGMNPWMEMSEFNENMFMSGVNLVGMMYGDIPMKDAKEENEGLRQMDMSGDAETFKDGYNRPYKLNVKHNDVDSIVRRIERYNPLVFRLLNRWGMPYEEAKAVVRRIVRLTLMYSEE